MKATVHYPCPACREPLERALEGPAAACEHCGAPQALRPGAGEDGKLRSCPACGLKVLYRQKDFRQAIGCLVVAVAAALAPFTLYLSLVVAALVDWILYRIAGEVIICYRASCKAHIRGIPPAPGVRSFDLSIHDYYRGQES